MDEILEESGLEDFECGCGAAGCRGRVGPRDYLRPELQARYAGYWPPFMARKLRALGCTVPL